MAACGPWQPWSELIRPTWTCSFYRTYVSSAEDTAEFEHVGQAEDNSNLYNCIKDEHRGPVRDEYSNAPWCTRQHAHARTRACTHKRICVRAHAHALRRRRRRLGGSPGHLWRVRACIPFPSSLGRLRASSPARVLSAGSTSERCAASHGFGVICTNLTLAGYRYPAKGMQSCRVSRCLPPSRGRSMLRAESRCVGFWLGRWLLLQEMSGTTL